MAVMVIPAKSSRRTESGASMIGIALMERLSSAPYTLPVLAGAGLSASTLAAADWTRITNQATSALALAGLIGGGVVGGVVFAISKYDQVKLNRQKLYDEANKDSLSRQIEEMKADAKEATDAQIANQERMRESLHSLRNDAQRAAMENHQLRDDLATLRSQFMAVSKQLHETDLLLHTARAEFHAVSVELQKTASLLASTATERDTYRAELESIRSSQVAQGQRIGALEKGSGPHEFKTPAATEAPR